MNLCADLNTEYNKFCNQVNEEYLYPSFGGKEKFDEVIKKLDEDNKKK